LSALAATPVLLPLAIAGLTGLVGERLRLQWWLSLIGAIALLVCALLLTAQSMEAPVSLAFGNWPAPYGIVFVIDPASSILLVVTAVMAVAALLFLASDADSGPRHPMLLPLLNGLLAGVGGAFATADLFNLYVWFEVMLIAAIGLFTLGGRADQIDASFKYFILNMLGTLLLLAAVAALYGATGHLNFGALREADAHLPAGLLLVILGALTLAFLIKAGSFPFFAWLPASYHSLPAPILALIAGLLTKVGIYAILRTLGDVFAPAPDLLYEALGWLAAATMLLGVLGAAYHWDMRRILAFHIISQVGYILLGIALASAAGNGASLFYTVHHIVVKANLFLLAAIIWRLGGSYDLRQIGGMYRAIPWLAPLLLIPALSLVGVPPLSGFWAKMLILEEAIAQGRIAWTVIALLVSVLTLYSMMKIWIEAFWKPHPDPNWHMPTQTRLAPAWLATIGLATITMAIGLHPEPLIAYAEAAARLLGQP